MTALSSGQQLSSSAVIVATGSKYRRLNVQGEDELIGSGVHFCATCDGPFYKGADESALSAAELSPGGGTAPVRVRRPLASAPPSDLSASSVLQDASPPIHIHHSHRHGHRRAGGRARPIRRLLRAAATAAKPTAIRRRPRLSSSVSNRTQNSSAGAVERDAGGFLVNQRHYEDFDSGRLYRRRRASGRRSSWVGGG